MMLATGTKYILWVNYDTGKATRNNMNRPSCFKFTWGFFAVFIIRGCCPQWELMWIQPYFESVVSKIKYICCEAASSRSVFHMCFHTAMKTKIYAYFHEWNIGSSFFLSSLTFLSHSLMVDHLRRRNYPFSTLSSL